MATISKVHCILDPSLHVKMWGNWPSGLGKYRTWGWGMGGGGGGCVGVILILLR